MSSVLALTPDNPTRPYEQLQPMTLVVAPETRPGDVSHVTLLSNTPSQPDKSDIMRETAPSGG
jgi:hypothetical protein